MRTFFLLLITLFTTMLPTLAAANFEISVTQGQAAPTPIAIPIFLSDGASRQLAAPMADVITQNLERSALFRSIPRNAHIERLSTLDTPPRFADWRQINAQLLVVGDIQSINNNQIRVNFRLWDILAQRQMAGFTYTTEKDNWRRIAHLVSDAIYKRVTGDDGYFDSRIVYVSEEGDPRNPRKRLAVMDQDGENVRYLTDGNALVLTPRFSPSDTEIIYLAYYQNTPRVYRLNIDSGDVRIVGNFPNMTFAPRYSPDGRTAIMSMARDGNTDIYTLDLDTGRVVRLTNHAGIDTSPSYSPDGKQIVFTSDRGGSAQLYVMNADGSNVKRITHSGGNYSTPVWSPRGDLIAFTKQTQGRFHIGVMRTDGSGERLLSQSFHDEGPTWSPNGRVIMFFRETPGDARGRGRSAALYSIDLTGHNLRRINTPTNASDPAWSGLNPP